MRIGMGVLQHGPLLLVVVVVVLLDMQLAGPQPLRPELGVAHCVVHMAILRRAAQAPQQHTSKKVLEMRCERWLGLKLCRVWHVEPHARTNFVGPCRPHCPWEACFLCPRSSWSLCSCLQALWWSVHQCHRKQLE